VTVLLFDIDDFKSYNDRYGHEVGDKLIREVAVLLRRCTRECDIVVRYGGDEFAVVFWDAEKQRVPGSEHPQEPIELATRFCQAIAQHDFECLGSDAPGPVTISGGLACFPWHGNTRERLIAAADEALLTAKRTGKNRIHLAGKADEEPTSLTAEPRK
jgi:two-component system cell cycle response regulator